MTTTSTSTTPSSSNDLPSSSNTNLPFTALEDNAHKMKTPAGKTDTASSGVKRKPSAEALSEPDGKTTKHEDIVAAAAQISEINITSNDSVYKPETTIAGTQEMNDILPKMINENNTANAESRKDWYDVSAQTQFQIEENRKHLLANPNLKNKKQFVNIDSEGEHESGGSSSSGDEMDI